MTRATCRRFSTPPYGSFNAWHQIHIDMFDRWSELTGITYVYEPNDDGVPFVTSGQTPASSASAGDIRIGGPLHRWRRCECAGLQLLPQQRAT